MKMLCARVQSGMSWGWLGKLEVARSASAWLGRGWDRLVEMGMERYCRSSGCSVGACQPRIERSHWLDVVRWLNYGELCEGWKCVTFTLRFIWRGMGIHLAWDLTWVAWDWWPQAPASRHRSASVVISPRTRSRPALIPPLDKGEERIIGRGGGSSNLSFVAMRSGTRTSFREADS